MEEVNKINDAYFQSQKELLSNIKEEVSLLYDVEKIEPFVTLPNGCVVEPQFNSLEDLKGVKGK